MKEAGGTPRAEKRLADSAERIGTVETNVLTDNSRRNSASFTLPRLSITFVRVSPGGCQASLAGGAGANVREVPFERSANRGASDP